MKKDFTETSVPKKIGLLSRIEKAAQTSKLIQRGKADSRSKHRQQSTGRKPGTKKQ